MVGRAVWEKLTKGRARRRWDTAAQEIWRHIGGNQEEMMPAENFGRHKTEVEERIELRAR